MKLAIALAPLLLAGCGAGGQMVTVAQILARCDAFKGQPVQAGGYLGECGGYDCHLFADEAAAHKPFRSAPTIGIGFEEGFDRKAKPLQNQYVVITGRVDDASCDGVGGTDRSPGIHPTDIRPWTRAVSAQHDRH